MLVSFWYRTLKDSLHLVCTHCPLAWGSVLETADLPPRSPHCRAILLLVITSFKGYLQEPQLFSRLSFALGWGSNLLLLASAGDKSV